MQKRKNISDDDLDVKKPLPEKTDNGIIGFWGIMEGLTAFSAVFLSAKPDRFSKFRRLAGFVFKKTINDIW